MKKLHILAFALLLSSVTLFAQEEAAEGGQSAAQANNPLANMTALNFHNYYMPKLSNSPDEQYMNTTWLRFAKPFSAGKLLLRVSSPISTIGVPQGGGNVKSVSGLGDVNAFMSYNFVSNSSSTVGAGPLITAPTATNELLGTGKWQGGFALVAFISKSPVFQYGALVTWQTSFAGQSDRESTNNAAVQPFYFWQLGEGFYLRGVPIWYFDFKNDAYSVPMALGLGKVVKVGDTMINCFVEPQYSIITGGVQPIFQVFTGINLQFM
ncbi:hypothetical protein JM658_04045 [Joostella atrarenae]|uniref:Neuromedin U n=1 Tax=Joostella atrarenae TaxID=679257 RepID=A0ABS9J0P4_9FLAO|nr:hypothetical protein [Joostella atrarenae]MCF8713991.1 hypothetical protein [Joostella atrarenae]